VGVLSLDTARWVVGRLGRLAALLVGVAIGCLFLIEISPIDRVNAYIGADMARVGPEQREMIAQRWGLDDSAIERTLAFLGQLARGNLGTSTIFNAPVSDVIVSRFATSIVLLAIAWVFSGVIGFTLGIVAAARAGTRLDRSIRWTAYTLASVPTFWVGLVALSLFSVALGWTPVCCSVPVGSDPSTASIFTRLHHLILPAATLSLVGIAPITLHTRQQAISILRSDFVTFARAQGEHGTGLIRRRVIRNAAVPALTLQFASLSELFGGAILAEAVFSYPGLGQATVLAGLRGDAPLLVGIALFSTVFVFVGNTLGDVAQSFVDPRVPLVPRRSALRSPRSATSSTSTTSGEVTA
jgi:peptide/nickel transport system permease protein